MQIKQPFCRTETYLQSFFPRTIRDWNVLPSFVITCSDNEKFKTGTSAVMIIESLTYLHNNAQHETTWCKYTDTDTDTDINSTLLNSTQPDAEDKQGSART